MPGKARRVPAVEGHPGGGRLRNAALDLFVAGPAGPPGVTFGAVPE